MQLAVDAQRFHQPSSSSAQRWPKAGRAAAPSSCSLRSELPCPACSCQPEAATVSLQAPRQRHTGMVGNPRFNGGLDRPTQLQQHQQQHSRRHIAVAKSYPGNGYSVATSYPSTSLSPEVPGGPSPTASTYPMPLPPSCPFAPPPNPHPKPLSLSERLRRMPSTINMALDGVGIGPVQRRLLVWALQLVLSLLSVVLYIWSTYQPPLPGTPRYCLDVALCAVFAAEFVHRVRSSAILSPMLLVDLLSFLPTLMEAALLAWDVNMAAKVHSVVAAVGTATGASWAALPDLKWLRILRSLRILRLVLLTGNLPVMKMSTSSLLSGSVNARLMQLVASVIALLFTSASLVHLAERMPWHDALYFVVTSLTTVGYGDVTVKTWLGRMVVLAMISVGVVLIPVRTGQLWSQLVSQRVIAGHDVPLGRPFVLLSGRIADVRSFSDLFTEFTAHLASLAAQNSSGTLPPDMHLVCLGSRPGNELLAFQELHDRRLTLVEGSALRPADLVRYRAAAASAILVMANRFSPDVETEDLDVLFRVWAIKSFTKCVPLTVQVLRASSLAKVKPFLDPDNDTITSTQQTRHRLLALSCMCPGASTLLCNLLQTAQTKLDLRASATRAPTEPPPQLAGRAWLAEYARGCGNELYVVSAGTNLHGVNWLDAVVAAFRQQHVLLLGINNLRPRGDGKTGSSLVLNPTRHIIRPGDQLLVIASCRQRAEAVASLSAIMPFSGEQCSEVPWYQATLRWALDYNPSSTAAAVGPPSAPAPADSLGTAQRPVPPPPRPKPLWSKRSQVEAKPSPEVDAWVQRATAQAQGSAAATSCPLPAALSELTGHVILSGSQDSFLEFARTLHSMWGQWRPTEPQWWPTSGSSSMDEEYGGNKRLPLVVLHPDVDDTILHQLREMGPVYEVRGSPSNPGALNKANAKQARCLVYMSSMHRPSTLTNPHEEQDYGTTSGAALRADAEALLTCYGVGEGDPSGVLVREEGWMAQSTSSYGSSNGSSNSNCNGNGNGNGSTAVVAGPPWAAGGVMEEPGTAGSGNADTEPTGLAAGDLTAPDLATSSFESDPYYIERGPPHTVCELAFTSSVRFLQPGLLLQGASSYDARSCELQYGKPRTAWTRREEAELACAQQGLVQYQTNVYYCAGRVVLPAHMDTFICQAFIKHRLLEDLMSELCRDNGDPGGSLLRQLPVPPQLGGRPYRELFQHLVDCHNVIPLGLLRPKVSENVTWRLDYVSTNPAWEDIVGLGDRVFVLRPGDM